MKMQCDLLVPDLKKPNTRKLVKENIEHISEGYSSHCAGALDLVLEQAFAFKKQSRGVKLRCTSPYCSLQGDPISFSSAASSVWCPSCGYKFYTECTGCERRRSGVYLSCEGCGKRFT